MRKSLRAIIASAFLISGLINPVWGDQPGVGSKQWRTPVASAVNLPTVGNFTGDCRYVIDTARLYNWTGAAWIAMAGTGVGDAVKVTAADTTSGYLNFKITVGDALTKTVVFPAANEELDLNVLYDDASVGLDGSNQLYVKDTGIVATMLNADTAGDGLSLDGGTNALEVNVDDVTIEIAVDILQVKDGGLTDAKLDTPLSPNTNEYLRYNGASMEWADPLSTLELSALHKTITQAIHGFVIGDVLRWDSGTSLYVKAQADSAANAEVAGIVSAVPDAGTFTLTLCGYTPGLAGLVAGSVYFLSEVTPGLLTATAPSAVGNVSKPLLIALSATEGLVYNWRGVVLGNPTAPASATFVTVSLDGTLTNERVLTAGADISVVDGGAGTTITVADTSTLQTVTTRGDTTNVFTSFTHASGIKVGLDETTPTPNIAGNIYLIAAGDSGYFTTVTTGIQTENTEYVLPLALPIATSGFLQSTTAGVMSWVAGGSVGVAGADTQVQYNNAGAFGADAGFTFIAASDQLFLGEAGQSGSLKLYSENGVTDHSVIIQPSASQSADNTYTLPTTYPGTSGYLLSATNTGAMSWVSPVAGADTNILYNNAGALGAEATFTYTQGTDSLTAVNINPNGGDGSGSIGAVGNRWQDIFCVNITTGDINMLNKWVIKEDWTGPNGIILVSPTGKKYKFVVEEYND